jgi:type IV secretory pathway VirD2 relaxase
MTADDDDIQIRPGRIRQGNRGGKRPKSFVAEVMRAAKEAGHAGRTFAQGGRGKGRSTFGRGRQTALSLASRSPGRRVTVMARIVRDQGSKFRSASLARHVTYLKHEGVTRDGADARMFDACSDGADAKAFAERCEEDRHHFRFIISPEDAADLESLRTFTRELMKDVERDLGTRLNWLAVDRWNTDNPHIHVLIRGRAHDGRDLVISRDYISRGFRDRAAERVTLELGPRSEQEIRASLENEVDPTAGPASTARYATSSTKTVESLTFDLATRAIRTCGVSCWAVLRSWSVLAWRSRWAPRLLDAEAGLEPALRDLGIRGDIIKTMHRAMSG